MVKPNDFKDEITIDDFQKVDLRVGEVISAEKMEKSDKLLILKVNVSGEIRQIVSGIADFLFSRRNGWKKSSSCSKLETN